MDNIILELTSGDVISIGIWNNAENFCSAMTHMFCIEQSFCETKQIVMFEREIV